MNSTVDVDDLSESIKSAAELEFDKKDTAALNTAMTWLTAGDGKWILQGIAQVGNSNTRNQLVRLLMTRFKGTLKMGEIEERLQAHINGMRMVWTRSKHRSSFFADFDIDSLIFNEKTGAIVALEANLYRILINHVDTRGLLVWNDFANALQFSRKAPWHDDRFMPYQKLEDTDLSALQRFLQDEFQGLDFAVEAISRTIEEVGKLTRINPVKDHMQNCHSQLYAPGQTLLLDDPDFVYQLFPSAVRHPLNAAYLRKFLISMVARVMQPGCKCDTVLVLVGDEGLMKSTFFRELTKPEWFTDKMPHVSKTEDFVRKMHGKLISEMAELDSLRGASIEQTKSLLSTQVDRFTPKYANFAVEYDRQGLIVGTANKTGSGLLNGSENRRFWIIVLEGKIKIDLDLLKKVRDLLLAEAVELYERGEQWWLTDSDDELQRVVNLEHTHELPDESVVRDYIAELEWVDVQEVATLLTLSMSYTDLHGKAMHSKPKTQRDIENAANILKKLGWHKPFQQRRYNGRKRSMYCRTNQAAPWVAAPGHVEEDAMLFFRLRNRIGASEQGPL